MSPQSCFVIIKFIAIFALKSFVVICRFFVQLFVEAGKKKEGCIEKSNKKSDPK